MGHTDVLMWIISQFMLIPIKADIPFEGSTASRDRPGPTSTSQSPFQSGREPVPREICFLV